MMDQCLRSFGSQSSLFLDKNKNNSFSWVQSISPDDANVLLTMLQNLLNEYGFEFYPFKVGWYNEYVHHKFHLLHDPDTIAFVIISEPSMFEKAFKQFITKNMLNGLKDPIDECMIHYFSRIKEALPHINIEIIHDFELNPNRRPKILMQTAGHVSGAAYYYQRKDLKNDPWDKAKKICGVSIHPKYGGWFALRGVAVFKNLVCPFLPRIKPLDVVNIELRQELLERYNFHWEDWSFRNIIPVEEEYSTDQRRYFSTKPKDRLQHINHMFL